MTTPTFFQKVREILRNLFLKDVTYKVLSLMITLGIWLPLLAKRDFFHTKEVEIQFQTQAGIELGYVSTEKIYGKFYGNEKSLRRLDDIQLKLLIPVRQRQTGFYDLKVPIAKLQLPEGVKIGSIKPATIRIELISTK